MTPEIENAIKHHADQAHLPIQLVRAIVLTESGGDRWKWRAEPAYRYLVNCRTGTPFRRINSGETTSEKPPEDFPANPGESQATEWWGQQASWGLCQIMGAVAREYGYHGSFTKLCDIDTGLVYGCKHLTTLKARFFAEYGWRGVAAAYNTGQPNHTSGAGHVYATKIANAGGFDFI